jgi:hypothetical protein
MLPLWRLQPHSITCSALPLDLHSHVAVVMMMTIEVVSRAFVEVRM